MDDLTRWLLEQIAEDERTTRAASADRLWALSQTGDRIIADAGFMQEFTPDRVLAECEAKRRIIARLAPVLNEQQIAWDLAEEVLQALALPYADREGYREEWRP